MGEYANYRGDSIKIGTCENLYYLRADQRHLVSGYDFSKSTLDVIRFRFPFPDEDQIEPGHFEDYGRGVRIPGWSLPETLSGSDGHWSVQFTARPGYVLSIPCPEQFGQPGMQVEMPGGLKVGRNGFTGHPRLKQQAFRGGVLVSLVVCGSCDAIHRLDTLEDAQPVIDAFHAEADRKEYRSPAGKMEYANSEDTMVFLRSIADRIEHGYVTTPHGALVAT